MTNMRILKNLLTFGACIALASCATQQSVHKDIKTMQKAPKASPHKSITNFSDGLRCMDNMMISYGVQDVSMLVEDLQDQTTKVNAGTKDMLITAVSKMTRRSRAIRLVPFGNDSGNLIAFLNAAGSSSAYNVVPRYDIRGSISQLDTNIVNKQLGGSLAANRWGVGASLSSAGTILGIDLSILSTNDLSVLPGVTSSNAVVLFKSGKGADADATIKNSGISFDFSVNKNDATVQALRNLIELASIELVGRLVKIPYWQCLGIPADNESVTQEMEDWYYSMRTHGELNSYVRSHLLSLGLYPRNQQNTAIAMTSAIRNYQRKIGLAETGQMDFNLFTQLLTRKLSANTASNTDIAPAQQDTVKIPASTKVEQNKTVKPTFSLSLKNPEGKQSFTDGETVSLLLASDKSAYTYCYFVDTQNQIQRFFPNRFVSDNLLIPGKPVELPGQMAFDIIADQAGNTETVHCFANENNLYYELPKQLLGFDFESLNVNSIDEIRAGFASTGDNPSAEVTFKIIVK